MKKNKIRYFTLFEVMVAIAVFAVGIVTAMAILVPAVRWGTEARTDFTAAEAAVLAVNEVNITGNTTTISCNGDRSFPYFVEFVNPTTDNGATERTVMVYRKNVDENDPGRYLTTRRDKEQFRMRVKMLK